MHKYWLATRPYSFTAAVVPVLIGTAVAVLSFPNLPFNVLHFVLALIGSVGAQAVSNLVNDLVDAQTGLDNEGNFGRFNCIVAGLVTRREALDLTLAIGAVSLLIGGYFIWVIGAPVAALVGVGVFLAIFYTAPPFRLKYVALGDVAVLLGFGLTIVAGAYVVQAYGQPNFLGNGPMVQLLAYALPSSLLVVAILHANNHRDRQNDVEYGARTMANILPAKASKGMLVGLLIGAYVLALGAAVLGLTTWFALLVLVSLPPLLKLLDQIKRDQYEGMLVPEIAKLHGLFGLLTTVAIILHHFIAFPPAG